MEPVLEPLTPFDHTPRTRLIFGPGTVHRLGELAKELGVNRALIVTDKHLVEAGHVGIAQQSLIGAGLSVAVFDQVRENPTTLDVDRSVMAAQAHQCDLLIGLGGGSSLDTAKGCNFILTNGGKMADYWGVGKAASPMLPMIAVPTTAGTGSECQSFALIADETTHQKMACGDPKAAPVIALLDPELTVTQPFAVTACTGIDAIAHAVETAVTRRRNPVSWLYSRESLRLTLLHFERALADPEDLEARSAMLLGAAYAGLAIENSMLGIAHSLANPLTAEFGIVHGVAVGMMLPHVIRFNANLPEVAGAYDELVSSLPFPQETNIGIAPHETLARLIEQCLRAARFPGNLAEAGVQESTLPRLAEGAAKQWTAQFNPRSASVSDFEALYRQAIG